jgi:hypothetical protein
MARVIESLERRSFLEREVKIRPLSNDVAPFVERTSRFGSVKVLLRTPNLDVMRPPELDSAVRAHIWSMTMTLIIPITVIGRDSTGPRSPHFGKSFVQSHIFITRYRILPLSWPIFEHVKFLFLRGVKPLDSLLRKMEHAGIKSALS